MPRGKGAGIHGSLEKARLYLVLDRAVADYPRLFKILRESYSSGVDVIQLRDKTGSSREILAFACQAVGFLRHRIPFIVNDRLDLALASGADGVHLGQDDMPVAMARRIVGSRLIIGASCQTMAQAVAAQKAGADYIGFGSVFKTLTKPDRQPMDLDLLKRVNGKIKVPVFAIGGIDQGNIAVVLNHGARRVAVTRAICLAPHPSVAGAQFKKIFSSFDIESIEKVNTP